MRAAGLPGRDTWGDEPQRRTPATGHPAPLEFLWALADVMGATAHYPVGILRGLGVRHSRDRVSTAGHLYATLAHLAKRGLIAYVVDVPGMAGKYRLTAAGLATVDRVEASA